MKLVEVLDNHAGKILLALVCIVGSICKVVRG
jgi:hypothetical protein